MQLIKDLQFYLNNEQLPGRKVQYEMAHGARNAWLNNYHVPQNAKQAATLALLYPENNDFHIALMKRVTNPKDRHSGQVSFPGGKVEKEDRNLAHTALRETEEELGIPQSNVSILGQLTDLYIPVSNFLVFPFIGFTPNKPDFQLQQKEVQQIVEAPISALLNKDNRKTTDLTLFNNLTLRDVPYFDINGNVVWGATAMMLNELTTIIEQITSAVSPKL